ncbi:PEP-CTERM sorting domain-containing protein [Sphingoaurantiacus capsulatus]|uniref:PEP-CTERM sorting domain-containing protein n=1 Tax=Sphingoaurantiacus capsulatus TaxID=1771310 RepID=A0ABV7X571_9SPHN
MRKFELAAVAVMMTTGVVSGANAAVISEVENNDTLATAMNIDPYFSTDYSANIGDNSTNTSTTIPHATINGYAEQGGRDWYRFSVATAGSRGIFDIDGAYEATGNFGFDSNITIYDAIGNMLGRNDDYNQNAGAGGSNHGLDSYYEYVFSTSGTYFAEISNCCWSQPFNQGNTGAPGAEFNYQFQVSIQNHATINEVPEPANLALLGLGLIGLAARRRRKIA